MFHIYIYIYIQIPKDLYAIYYKENKENLQKDA